MKLKIKLKPKYCTDDDWYETHDDGLIIIENVKSVSNSEYFLQDCLEIVENSDGSRGRVTRYLAKDAILELKIYEKG